MHVEVRDSRFCVLPKGCPSHIDDIDRDFGGVSARKVCDLLLAIYHYGTWFAITSSFYSCIEKNLEVHSQSD